MAELEQVLHKLKDEQITFTEGFVSSQSKVPLAKVINELKQNQALETIYRVHSLSDATQFVEVLDVAQLQPGHKFTVPDSNVTFTLESNDQISRWYRFK